MSEIKFEATLGTPKIEIPKSTPMMAPTGGGIEVSLVVARPNVPPKPMESGRTELHAKRMETKVPGPFVEPEQNEREAKAAYAKRVKAARADHEKAVEVAQEVLAGAKAGIEEYARETARWEADMEKAKPALMAYANLAKLVAAFGGYEVRVAIAPTGKGLIPGMVQYLLEAPSE